MAKDIIHKDFILKVTFVGSNAETHRDNVPIGLMWSTSFECPFVYLPMHLRNPISFFPSSFRPVGPEVQCYLLHRGPPPRQRQIARSAKWYLKQQWLIGQQ